MLSPSPPVESVIRSPWSVEATLREIMLLVLLSSILFPATILHFQNYLSALQASVTAKPTHQSHQCPPLGF
jgi:hypothetical protein